MCTGDVELHFDVTTNKTNILIKIVNKSSVGIQCDTHNATVSSNKLHEHKVIKIVHDSDSDKRKKTVV